MTNDDWFASMDEHFDKINRDLNQIKWMVGFALALTLATFTMLFML